MPCKRIPLVFIILVLQFLSGCELLSPTEPSRREVDEGFFGQVGGQSVWVFELDAPQIIIQVNWQDEYNAGGGWIGGVSSRSTASELVQGVWQLITQYNFAWDWTGYTDLEPDGVIISTYPHQFQSIAGAADGTIQVRVRHQGNGTTGWLYGNVTGGIVEEIQISNKWARRLYVKYDITSGTGPLAGYSGRGVAESIFQYSPAIWLQNSIDIFLNVTKMYWTDSSDDNIKRANLDGSNMEVLVTGQRNPRGVAIDIGAGKMYWSDVRARVIRRSNLNGSNIEDMVTGIQAWGIALDPAGGKIYWCAYNTLKIQRANIDGSNIEDLYTAATGSKLRGIALDILREKVYWADTGIDLIQRANLDGSNVEDLVISGLRQAVGIVLDISEDKMYWADRGRNKIQRANLDGSNVEDLVTGLANPAGISLDIASGKIYWTDDSTDLIQRCNLDGSNVETVVSSGLLFPRDIVLR